MLKSRINRRYLLAIGSFSLLISILLGRIGAGIPIIEFLEGMFMGLSLTLNLAILIEYSINKRTVMNEKKQIEV
ncbi:MAG: hypothetical protein ACFFBP_16395 [Promethearchaeota archaeon]